MLQRYNLTEPKVGDLADFQRRFGSGNQEDFRLLGLIFTLICLSLLTMSASGGRLPLICGLGNRFWLSQDFLIVLSRLPLSATCRFIVRAEGFGGGRCPPWYLQSRSPLEGRGKQSNPKTHQLAAHMGL